MTLAFALVLSTVPQFALAATKYTDAIAGREIFATSTLGVFAGAATGDLNGSWSAFVYHTPLSPSAIIRGGSFALATTVSGSAATVSGTFVYGGTVTQELAGANCTKQTYKVQATLVGVGVGGGDGTGTFEGTLTHLRRVLWARCITTGATITGVVTLTY
jgi:hypothetical protein